MARRFPARAEVLARRDEPAAEETLPHAVDGDARRERVLARGEPASEAEAIARRGCREIGQHARDAGRDRVAGIAEAPLDRDVGRARLGKLLEHHRRRDRREELVAPRLPPARDGGEHAQRRSRPAVREGRGEHRQRLSGFFLPRSEFARLLHSRDADLRRGRVPDVRRRVEEGGEAVVVLLRERIVLVVVALRACERRAEPHGRGRVHAVDDRGEAELLRVRAAFLVHERVAVEARRDPRIERRVGQEVAGELFDRELLEGHVAIERVDDPVAPRPEAAAAVLLVPVRVRVAREVEPSLRHALGVALRGEEAVDGALVGVAIRVALEGVELGSRRRDPGEVEGDAAQELPLGRLGRGSETLSLEAREDEAVDRVPDPGPVLHVRRRRLDGSDVGPVLLLLGDARR